MCMLQLSKIPMYKYHYDYINKKKQKKIKNWQQIEINIHRH